MAIMANEQKQKIYMSQFHTLECLSNFLHIKTKKIWIATVNYQRIAKNFNSFEISQIKRQDRQDSGKTKVNSPIVFPILIKRTKLHQNSFNHS